MSATKPATERARPNVQVTREGWWIIPVSDSLIEEAKRMRALRDRLYPNLYVEEETDLRWAGDLGELVLFDWLREQAPGQGRWLRKKAAGRADFLIAGAHVGMKTVKRRVPFRPQYTAQISARHAEEPVDEYFFASYEAPASRIWLLGGIARSAFLSVAKRYSAGEWVHPHYQIREGHEILNAPASLFVPPVRWLRSLGVAGAESGAAA